MLLAKLKKSPERPKIVITGASGRIGAKLVSVLGKDFEFIEWPLLTPGSSGSTGLIHLAANPDMSQDWSDVVKSGVSPTLLALETARLSAIPQFVYASSCYVVNMQSWKPGDVIPADVEPSPQTPYGLGKSCCEALARFYAEVHGLTVDVLRMGWVIDVQKDKIYYPVVFSIYCNVFDLSRLIKKLFSVKHAGFNSFYAVSRGTTLRWDLENARKILNYRPRHHVLLSTGPLVVRDYLRRLPGIIYRGLRSTVRNRFNGKPSEENKRDAVCGDVQYNLVYPLCGHPTDVGFFRALNDLYSFLEQGKNKCVTILFFEVPSFDEDAVRTATQKLFWQMALLMTKYFLNQGHSVEVKWKTNRL